MQYYVRRREDLRGKRVVIAGGGDSAVDWALALKDFSRVAVVHRRAKFRAAPESVAHTRLITPLDSWRNSTRQRERARSS